MDETMIYYILATGTCGENNLKKFLESIANGANVHYKNEYPLILAASKGYTSFVSVIINVFNANINSQNGLALKNACVFGHMEVVMCLIDNGADVNLDDGTALIWSLYKTHFDIAKYLIQKGAKVNVKDELPLKICIEKGNLEMIKCLVENGADVLSNFLDEKYLRNLIENGKGSIVVYLEGVKNEKKI